MSLTSQEQVKVYNFLLKKFTSQEAFTKEEFQAASGWQKPKTFKTYWSKQFKTLLVPVPGGKYQVSEVFRRFTSWDKFQLHVTQNRRVAADYTTLTFDTVMLFEFFMPLTNEGYLRTSLDALFYEDTIMSRLKTVEIGKLKLQFLAEIDESDEAYLKRICKWVSNKIGGYSISHVNGRFRAMDLKTTKEAYELVSKKSGRYLVDETTAIVRFIFPCGEPSRNRFIASSSYLEKLLDKSKQDLGSETQSIRYFFHLLFVQSIVEIVNGEDEIWLLESGYQSKLHIWRVQNDC